VGYRINSKKATEFRIWATKILKEYMTKGFALNDERFIKGNKYDMKYFDELLERIKTIRVSERMSYQKITDLFIATSTDYDPKSESAYTFFKIVQNKLHYAISGHTAAELIYERANSEKEHMGLTNWKNSPDGLIYKYDVSIAKNYLTKEELKSLERIVTMYLDYAEDQAERHIPMTMEDWKKRLDVFLQFNEREVLDNPDISSVIKQLYMPLITKLVQGYFGNVGNIEEVEFDSFNAVLQNLFSAENLLKKEDISVLEVDSIVEVLANKINEVYQKNHQNAKEINAEDELCKFERHFILRTVNEKWMDHIDAISALKEGINLRAYGQSNPLEAYKIESFNMFEELIQTIQETSTKAVFSLRAKKQENLAETMKKDNDRVTNLRTSGGGETSKREPVRAEKKVGRNDPCPCGSGRKYKQCCGK